MTLRIQCQCGALGGQLRAPERALRGVCYCRDCRAYAHHLGQASTVHDALGGIAFVATQARHVSLDRGVEHLACRSLSDKGLLRWYAACCNTPLANTTRNWKFPYVGLPHTCLTADPGAFERSFPRIQMRVNSGSAIAPPPGLRLGTVLALAGFVPRVVADGLSGAYRHTPFFDRATGAPAAKVAVLSAADKARAYSAL